MTDRTVLGISDSHNSTACLIKNGQILSCISEERLNRVKNYCGFPILSVRKILEINDLHPSDIDLVCFGEKTIPDDWKKIVKEGDYRPHAKTVSLLSKIFPNFLESSILRYFYVNTCLTLRRHSLILKQNKKCLEELGINTKRVVYFDHHLSHAASSYFFSPKSKKPKLVITADGSGDGLCATVSIGNNFEIERKVSIPFIHSIGSVYSRVTWHLGMKPAEDEYKVMGLAPYANEEMASSTTKIFENIFSIDRRDLRKFRNNKGLWGESLSKHMKNELAKKRFDVIAHSVQKVFEEVLTKWVSNLTDCYNIQDVVAGGGLFMNIKANQKILNLKNLRSLFVFPSCGDESLSIGSAILGYLKLCSIDGVEPRTEELKTIYFGPNYNSEIENFAKSIKKKYKVDKMSNIEKDVGELLSKGNIVARFDDSMEYGARALGNRSILADPRSLTVIRELNEHIKQRDFWMPFAPTILRECAENYLKIPNKKFNEQHMMFSFDTTDLARKELIAALHQADLTCRPQILDKDWNPKYFKTIKTFEDLTGIGGVLNTSFNLHGDPIVCSPRDAIRTFEKSKLKYLALGDFLIEKL
jgi:carbamoyltransferase